MKFNQLTLLIVILIILVSVGGCTQSPSGQVLASISETPQCEDVKVPYEEQEEYLKTEYYTETVPYTDQECETQKLIYSIEDFKIKYPICNKQEEVCHQSYPLLGCTDKTVYCVDRTVTCTLELNNHDDENGQWKIQFNYMKYNTQAVEAT